MSVVTCLPTMRLPPPQTFIPFQITLKGWVSGRYLFTSSPWGATCTCCKLSRRFLTVVHGSTDVTFFELKACVCFFCLPKASRLVLFHAARPRAVVLFNHFCPSRTRTLSQLMTPIFYSIFGVLLIVSALSRYPR